MVVFCILTFTVDLSATPPAWWSERGVLTSGSTPDDYAAINQGQLKNIAAKAAAEMNARLPGNLGGAGTAITDLLLTWNEPGTGRDDYAVVNQGQLKAVAKLFYDRLIAVGYTTTYPWSMATTDDDNYSVVNIGQVKYLFAFDLALDVDNGGAGDGLPDWWEQLIVDADPNDAIEDIDDVLPGDDFDGDGLTNQQEYQGGHDPGIVDGPDMDTDGMADQTEPSRGATVGPKDHPAVKLEFNLSN